MNSMDVFSERDYVILAFPSRGRDLTMSPDTAERLAEVGLKKVAECEAWINAGGIGKVVEGKPMECTRPMSWDGKVNIRFSESADRIPIHYKAAKEIFEEMKAKVIEARFRLTILDRRRAVNIPNIGGDF